MRMAEHGMTAYPLPDYTVYRVKFEIEGEIG
jgi:hypothetical protein